MFSAASNAVSYWLGWGQEIKSQESKASDKQDSTAETDISWEVVEHAADDLPEKLDTALANKAPESTVEVVVDKKPESLEIPSETNILPSHATEILITQKIPELPEIVPAAEKIEVVADGPIAEYQPHAEVKEIQRSTSARLLDTLAENRKLSVDIDSPRSKSPSPLHGSSKLEAKCAMTHPVIIKPQPESPRDLDDTFASCTGAFSAIRDFLNDFFAGFSKPKPDRTDAPQERSASKRMVSI